MRAIKERREKMARFKTKIRLSRPRKRSFAESVEFPRWVVAAGVLLIGFMLLLGALSDASGELRTPGLGSVLYMAAVAGIASLLIYTGRRRHPSGKDRRSWLASKRDTFGGKQRQ